MQHARSTQLESETQPIDYSSRDCTLLARRQRTIEHLSQLLASSPAAEELATTWDHPPHNPPSSSSSVQRIPKLHDLRKAFDAGKTIALDSQQTRGVPMWIVVSVVIGERTLTQFLGSHVQSYMAS